MPVLLSGSDITQPGPDDSVTPSDINEVVEINVILNRPLYDGLSLKQYTDAIIAGDKPVMSHDEFDAVFSVSDSDLDMVAAFGASYGIAEKFRSNSSGYIKLQGTVGSLNTAFGINLQNVTTTDRTYRSYAGEISVPENLADKIIHVMGLDTYAQIERQISMWPDFVINRPNADIFTTFSETAAAVAAAAAGLIPVVVGLVVNKQTSTWASQNGGNIIEIHGFNFTGTTAVNFGALLATSFTVIDDNTLLATAPAYPGGAPPTLVDVDVTVTNAAGTSAISTADQLTYAGGPVVNSPGLCDGWSQLNVPYTGGTVITLTGAGFSYTTFNGTTRSGVTEVNFEEPGQYSVPAAAFNVINDNLMTVTTPALPLGSSPYLRLRGAIVNSYILAVSFNAPLTPPQVAAAYQFPSGTGTGARIAIIEVDGGYTQSDLNSSFALFGVTPPTIVDVSVNGGANYGNDGAAAVETMLDIVCCGGVAPDATLYMYWGVNQRRATSTTSLTIGTGTRSLTVETGQGFFAGQGVYIVYDRIVDGQATAYMYGTVTSYNSVTGALVANITSVFGSGTYDVWTLYLGGVSNDLQVIYDTVNAAVSDKVNDPSVISISYGYGVGTWSRSTITAFETTFQAAVAKGISCCVASGDDGAQGRSDSQGYAPSPSMGYPGGSPYCICVGGTLLQISGSTITSEVVWNNYDYKTSGATGGGMMDGYVPFDLPSYQTNLNLTATEVITPVFHGLSYPSYLGNRQIQTSKQTYPRPTMNYNNGMILTRGAPDLAANSASLTGYQFYYNGSKVGPVGGTSAAAPVIAGLIAIINSNLNKRIGFINNRIYTNPGAFRDITQGNNCNPLIQNQVVGWQATTGWDPCTGMGSPIGTSLQALYA